MRRRNTLILLVLPLLAVLLLVGCGGGEATTTPSPTSLEIPRISVEDVKAKLDAGSNIVIVDARSQANYERESIAGAISIPLSDLLDENGDALSPEQISQRYANLQGYDEIITYCS